MQGEDPAAPAPGTEKKGWSTGKKVAVGAAAVGGLTATANLWPPFLLALQSNPYSIP